MGHKSPLRVYEAEVVNGGRETRRRGKLKRGPEEEERKTNGVKVGNRYKI